jgi:hypothetical protein
VILCVGVVAAVSAAVALDRRHHWFSAGRRPAPRLAVIGDGAPYAVGHGAANIPLDAGNLAVMTRWVARHSGRLQRLYLRVKVEGSTDCPFAGRPGYAAGDSGLLVATTHPVLPDGSPDMSRVLESEKFGPCARQEGESVFLSLGLDVRKGQEYATVIRNGAADPGANWFSLNFLYIDRDAEGANARNTREPSAPDAFYHLDPRELVGYSTDAGDHWSMPGGPYGEARRAVFLPTYIQEYADGYKDGQAYYYAHPLRGLVTMVYPNVPVPWRIREIGGFTDKSSSAAVEVWVNDRRVRSVRVGGDGLIRTPMDPVTVPAGATVRVVTHAGPGGLALGGLRADAEWNEVMGFGSAYAYHRSEDPPVPATIYPMPMYTAGP